MQTQNKKAGRPIHSTVELKKRIASLNTQVHYRNHKLKEKSARIVELLKENKELKYQLEQATNDLDITQKFLGNSYDLNDLIIQKVAKEAFEPMVKKDNLFVTLKKWITKTK